MNEIYRKSSAAISLLQVAGESTPMPTTIIMTLIIYSGLLQDKDSRVGLLGPHSSIAPLATSAPKGTFDAAVQMAARNINNARILPYWYLASDVSLRLHHYKGENGYDVAAISDLNILHDKSDPEKMFSGASASSDVGQTVSKISEQRIDFVEQGIGLL